jgi:hypothetical protein
MAFFLPYLTLWVIDEERFASCVNPYQHPVCYSWIVYDTEKQFMIL